MEITDAGTPVSFDVQLNLSNLKVEANRSYCLDFRARADVPRRVFVGIAQSHDPWMNLGLYRQLELSPEWRDYHHEFVASSGDDQARLHFDIGGEAIPVELSLISVREQSSGSDGQTGRNVLDLDLGVFGRLTPISRNWGFDRGLAIDRYYIEEFLASHASDIRGRVLEIEDGMYTRQFGGDAVTDRDVLHVTAGNPRATIVGDLADGGGIPSDRFDCALITQTLQLIYDVRAAVATLYRILKPGGVLLATVPGITRISHEEWAGSWFWLFTSSSAKRLFGDIFGESNVDVQTYGNVLTAVSFLHGLAKEEMHPAELDYRDPDYQVIITVKAVKRTGAR